MAAEYRAEQPANGKRVNFNLRRLRRQNEEGTTSREIAREIVDKAKAEGRELGRPSDYATQHWKAH